MLDRGKSTEKEKEEREKKGMGNKILQNTFHQINWEKIKPGN